MKKQVLFLCLTMLSIGVGANNMTKIIQVTTPGTLGTFLNSIEKTGITDITVTGNIDARDFKCMRDTLKALATVDLSAVNIQAFTGAGGTMTGTSVNYPANEFPGNAFMGKPTLTTIILPNTITSMGSYCLMSCSNLSGTITIPNSVTSIGDFAFQICQNISGLVLGTGIKSIGLLSFASCSKISGILNIPNSTITIGQGAFQYCSAITEINIGTSIVSLGQYPFLDCTGLTKISIANQTPPVILSNTFQGVSKNTFSLVVPSTSISAYQSANYWKEFLSIVGGAPATLTKTLNVSTPGTLSTLLAANEKLTLTNLTLTGIIDARDVKCLRDELAVLSSLNLEAVSINAFNGLGGTILASTSYPANEMPAYSFYNINSSPRVSKVSLTSFIFPTSITSIGDYAFFQCSGLTGILSIPSSVTNIGNSVYQDCTGISGKLVLPNSLTTIRNCTFGWCSGLTELAIGSMVNAIESEAFTDCNSITKVSIATVVPPTITSNSFGFYKSTCTLYVPIGSSTVYKKAEYWGDFEQILEYNTSTNFQNLTENKVKIYNVKSTIIVEGASKNEVVSIYSTDGKLISSVKSNGQTISIPIQKGIFCLVKTSHTSQKIMTY